MRNADVWLVTFDTNSLLQPGQGLDDWSDLFSSHRVASLPGGRVLTGRLRTGLSPDSPAVQLRLAEWPGSHAARLRAGGWELLLYAATVKRERWWLHILLFVLTLFSTVVAGSLLSGVQPIQFDVLPLFGGSWLPVPVALDATQLARGIPFGFVLVLILTLHESGHYFAARYHGMAVTPPFFIPFPPYISVIGTLGAFIRLRSPVLSRPTLFDVGVAGPLLSFFASLPPLWWGLRHSRIIESQGVPAEYLISFASEYFWLGGSVAMSAITRLITGSLPEGHILLLHPVAFAGWLGLFVTALNLLPISQLDGGHILYAMMGRHQQPLAWLFFAALIPLGFLWPGWWIWAVLIFVVGRGRVGHPPVFDPDQGLSAARFAVGSVAWMLFVLCFVPAPFGI